MKPESSSQQHQKQLHEEPEQREHPQSDAAGREPAQQNASQRDAAPHRVSRDPTPEYDQVSADRQSASQREQLNRSEREAKRTQPENYQEDAAAEKVVSTERDDQHEVGAIQGLDNKPQRSQRNKT